jgi:hypothetical protein
MQYQEMIREDGSVIYLVHFVFKSPKGIVRQQGKELNAVDPTWKIACAPGLVEMEAQATRAFPWMRSDDPRAVSCPLCQRTAEYRIAMDFHGERLPGPITPGGQIPDQETVHMVVRQEGKKDQWRIVCLTDKLVQSEYIEHKWPVLQTPDPRAVTCPLCKNTLFYKQRLHEETVNAQKVKR